MPSSILCSDNGSTAELNRVMLSGGSVGAPASCWRRTSPPAEATNSLVEVVASVRSRAADTTARATPGKCSSRKGTLSKAPTSLLPPASHLRASWPSLLQTRSTNQTCGPPLLPFQGRSVLYAALCSEPSADRWCLCDESLSRTRRAASG